MKKYNCICFILFIFILTTVFAEQHKHSEGCSHAHKNGKHEHYNHEYGDKHNHKHGDAHHHEHGDKHNHKHDDEHHHEHGGSLSDEGIHFNPQQTKNAEIKISKAGKIKISIRKRFPAEVKINEDKTAHLSPVTFGVVKQVYVSEGEKVEKGQPLAILDCPEIGETKLDFLTSLAKIDNILLEFRRARTIAKNTRKLISMLAKEPELDSLRELRLGELGENRSLLIGEYANHKLAKAEFLRQRSLRSKNLSSVQEFENTKTTYKKARAVYEAILDTVKFKIKKELQSKENDLRIANFKRSSAARKLQILGVDKQNIATLEKLFQESSFILKSEDSFCSTCNDKQAINNSNNLFHLDHSLASHIVKSPINGHIIERHCVVGERIEAGNKVFEISNLNQVWVDVNVPSKQL